MDPNLGGWRRLGCAVLVRAWRDTHSTNGDKAAREAGLPKGTTLAADARQFLESDGARGLVLALDLGPEGLDRVLAHGLWDPPKGQASDQGSLVGMK